MNLENIADKISVLQIKKGKLLLGIFVLAIVISLPGILSLFSNIEPSLEKVLPQKELETMNDMRAQFGADMMFILVSTDYADKVTNYEVVEYVNSLSNLIRTNEYILQVNNYADPLINEFGFIPKSSKTTAEFINKNFMSQSLVNADNTLTVIQIRSDTGAEARIIKQVVEQIRYDIELLESRNPGVTTKLTGFNAIDKATFEVIINDFAFITGFSFLFMVIFLFVYFKNYKKVIGAVVLIMTAVIITLGITGYLGITITVVTMVAAAMIMALGISYGINVTHSYYLLRKNFTQKESIKHLNREIIRALLGSSLTTSAGFLALLAGVMPAMKSLGIVLALGISVTLVISVLFLPILIVNLERRQTK